ncbi:hypothetical protein F4811DRAFT_562859 [Daldinia bambusicola]|nr:hypothetical protein F4811DRAFT_562859 [Daldinia bambusicola]
MKTSSVEHQTKIPLDYSNSGPGILISSYVLALVTTIVVALRIRAKRLISSSLGLDDYLVLSCLFIHHIFICFGTVAVIRGGLGQDMRIIAQDPSAVVVLFKFLFMAEVAYGFSCTLVKLSVLTFYLKIFPTRTVRIASTVLGLISISWTIAVQVVHLIQCRPLEALWHQEIRRLPETKCIDIILFLMGNSVANCVVDFCTIVLPVQEVLKLQMSRPRKISVCATFLLSSTAFAASLTRTVSTARMHRQGTHNFTKQFIASGLASAVEVYLAIIGACLPTLGPVYRKLRYGHPSGVQRAGSIITVGNLSNRVQLGTESERPFESVSDEGEFTLTPYRGSFQVSTSSQGKRSSLSPESLELPAQGIVAQQDTTMSESTKHLV